MGRGQGGEYGGISIRPTIFFYLILTMPLPKKGASVGMQETDPTPHAFLWAACTQTPPPQQLGSLLVSRHQPINPSPSSLSLSLQGCPALGKPDIQTEVWSASETINLAGEGYQAGGLGSCGLENIWASWPSTPPPTRTSHLCQSLREHADFLSFFFLKMNRAGCGRRAGPICPLPRLNLIPIHPPLFASLF